MTINKQKAVFLDRDGVLNAEIGNYVTALSNFTILPHIYKSLKLLVEHNFLLIVITNQGGIAKGLYNYAQLNQMHAYLKAELLKQQIHLTEIFYCPHHPDYMNCLCRKPKPLLVQKAISKYHINPSASYFIGDRQRDIDAATNAGVNGILIESNANYFSVAQNIVKNKLL